MKIEEYIEYILENTKGLENLSEETINYIQDIKDRLLLINLYSYLLIALVAIGIIVNLITFIYLIHKINQNKIEMLKLTKEIIKSNNKEV